MHVPSFSSYIAEKICGITKRGTGVTSSGHERIVESKNIMFKMINEERWSSEIYYLSILQANRDGKSVKLDTL
jgi:hypothetical protein